MKHIFDSHAHYDDARFSDREELLTRFFDSEAVAGIVDVACDQKDFASAMALARRFDSLWFAAGIHPEVADQWNEETEQRLKETLSHPKCVALGEIGLDYHFPDNPSREVQKRVFVRQLQLASEANLPVIIHSRDACEDTLEILRSYRPQGVMHCFSYSPEVAKEVCTFGMYVGFNGVVTFKNAKKPKEAAKAIPADRLLIETDCPYMAPEPHRGERCDSSLLPFVVSVLASERGEDAEKLALQTEENAKRLFRI